METRAAIDAIDGALPQTQCTRCGYADCSAYASAIVDDLAPIDRCPPGGESTLAALVALTGRAADRVDPECGDAQAFAVAVIDASRCIGCTICIQVCPVDAISGAPRRLHALIDPLCSGCGLCVAPCPVDCITMMTTDRPWTPVDAMLARERHRARVERLRRDERIADRRKRPAGDGLSAEHADTASRRRTAVNAAIARARARREPAASAGG